MTISENHRFLTTAYSLLTDRTSVSDQRGIERRNFVCFVELSALIRQEIRIVIAICPKVPCVLPEVVGGQLACQKVH
ncbi:hypothetical protein TcWFU_008357 [Taenia crassiceps]|uniref:Uncharacterized protein n=1 Tax=Taenia crassiceps TaxID=6207 RepID=A0ABR4QSX1_9CEST